MPARTAHTHTHPHAHTKPGDTPRTRNWANILAIFVGVTLLALSIWPGGVTVSREAVQEVGNPDFVYIVHILAGAGALVAVYLAQRWERRILARGLLVTCAILLLGALLGFAEFGGRAVLTMLLPAALLIVAAMGIGPLPDEPAPVRDI